MGSTSHLQNPLLQMIRILASTFKIHTSGEGVEEIDNSFRGVRWHVDEWNSEIVVEDAKDA